MFTQLRLRIAVLAIVVLFASGCSLVSGPSAPAATVTTETIEAPAETPSVVRVKEPQPEEVAPTPQTEATPAVARAKEPEPEEVAPTPQTEATPAVARVEEPEPKEVAPTPIREATPAAKTNGTTPQAEDILLTQADKAISTVDVVKLLRPSVVHIATQVLTMGMFNQPTPQEGVGTGVILDQRGNILTNNHVVAGAERIIVTLNTGASFPAQLVGRDPITDTAVIRIDAPSLQPAMLGNSSELEVGEDIIAIGHALGLRGGPTVSKGVVSALERSIDSDGGSTLVDLIQTDASINPGNSGGPLVNTTAEVIGINTAILLQTQGIGFAINIDDVKVVVAQLMANGSVNRGFLGISPINLTPALIAQFDIPAPADLQEGIVIVRVTRGSAADRAGLGEGDIIVEMGDSPIPNTGQLSKFLIEHPPGDTVDVVFFRGERKSSTRITLGQRPTR